MDKMKLKLQKLRNLGDEYIPFYATSGSAGMDLVAALETEELVIGPMEVKLVPTGVAIELPIGYQAEIRPRSGLALKQKLTVLNSPGTIDSDYRGEIMVIIMNLGTEAAVIKDKMRIAQMVITKYSYAEIQVASELEDSTRGTGGFGSTGAQVVLEADATQV